MNRLPTLAGVALAVCAFPIVATVRAQDAAEKPAGEATPAPTPAATVELKDPVAVVNGKEISKAELEEVFSKAVGSSGMDPSALSADQKMAGYRKLLDDMIVERLVKAESEGVTVSDEEVDKEIANIKKQFPTEEAFQEQLKKSGQSEEKIKVLIGEGMKQNKWVESQVGDKGKVTDEEAKKFYDENTKEFEQPEQVKASHILFMVPEGASEEVVKEKEAAAKTAMERGKKGEDFNALAKELSEEPGAKESGGDLGFFSKDRMVPEFAEAAFKQKVDEIGGPVRSQFGFHVIKVTEKKPGGTMAFEEVKPQLVGFLGQKKQQEAVTEVIDGLRKKAKVEINLPEAKEAN